MSKTNGNNESRLDDVKSEAAPTKEVDLSNTQPEQPPAEEWPDEPVTQPPSYITDNPGVVSVYLTDATNTRRGPKTHMVCFCGAEAWFRLNAGSVAYVDAFRTLRARCSC